MLTASVPMGEASKSRRARFWSTSLPPETPTRYRLLLDADRFSARRYERLATFVEPPSMASAMHSVAASRGPNDRPSNSGFPPSAAAAHGDGDCQRSVLLCFKV
jgi:hypothetical protein